MLPAKGREQQRSQRSIASLADSHTEFFDACEVFLSASSSENEVGDLGAGVGREGSAEPNGTPRLVMLPLVHLSVLSPHPSPLASPGFHVPSGSYVPSSYPQSPQSGCLGAPHSLSIVVGRGFFPSTSHPSVPASPHCSHIGIPSPVPHSQPPPRVPFPPPPLLGDPHPPCSPPDCARPQASDDESCISEATNSIDEDLTEPGGPGRPQTGIGQVGGGTGCWGRGTPVHIPMSHRNGQPGGAGGAAPTGAAGARTAASEPSACPPPHHRGM